MGQEIRKPNQSDAFNLWLNFMVTGVAFATPLVIAYFFRPLWLPFVTGALTILLFLYVRNGRGGSKKCGNHKGCYILPYIFARTMYIFTIISALLSFWVATNGGFAPVEEKYGKLVHVCYFPILIIAPLLAFNALRALWHRHACLFCVLCWIHNGFPQEQGYLRNFMGKEYLRVIKSTSFVGCLLTVGGWLYFLFLYNSANVSSYDSLIFAGVPLLLWFIHACSLSVRCLTIAMFRDNLANNVCFIKGKSYYRFLIFVDDCILLARNEKFRAFDTPASCYFPYSGDVRAQEVAASLNLNAAECRVLYVNDDASNDCSMIHCALFFDSRDDVALEGQWHDTKSMNHLFSSQRITRVLRNEYFRIRAAVSAYKTYNEDGSRRCRIKEYFPKFNLSDIRTANFDLSNPKWMINSIRNEDHPSTLWRFIYYRYFEGQNDLD